MELKCGQIKMDEEREEGELTDEEFEDITDDSSLESFTTMLLNSPNLLGREPFKELSVTSVSDESSDGSVKITNIQPSPVKIQTPRRVEYSVYNRHKEKHYPTPERLRYTKKRKYHERSMSVSESSSDSDDYISDKRLLRQLRNAVRISSAKKTSNCSLRTRLKRMIEPSSPSSKNSDHSDQELENLRDQALKSKITNTNSTEEINPSTAIDPTAIVNDRSENLNDEDLTNLRLIALKSAILKKQENRKKRKLLQDENKEKDKSQENDKNEIDIKTDDEFNLDFIESLIDKANNNAENVPTTDNETEKTVKDIISNEADKNKELPENKSIKNENIAVLPTEDDEDILRAMLLTSISKKIARAPKVPGPPKTEFKRSNPLISNTIVVNKPKPIILKKTIPFVKKPILKPLVVKPKPIPSLPVNRLIINVNTDSDSEENEKMLKKSPTKSVPTKRFEQKLSSFLREARKKSEQQSDISKHLPRSQQIEYRHLKRKLQQLLKKNEPIENKLAKKITKTKLINPIQPPIKTLPNGRNNFIEKVDRLNLKGKYEELSPLMLKISKSRAEWDEAQNDVKRLINELKNAKIKLTTSHQTYTNLVQQLLHKKAELERENNLPSSDKKQPEQAKTPRETMCTSTPNKLKLNITACEISQIETPPDGNQDQETIKEISEPKPVDTKEISCTAQLEYKDVISKETNVCVPEENAIDDTGFTKYSSPLDHIQKSRFVQSRIINDVYIGNPLLVLCPYDLLGVCKDPDCTYRHCGATGTD